MPHVAYPLAFVQCPWTGCGFRIAMVDFRLELGDDRALYTRVVLTWQAQPDYGIVARCPGCQKYVWFGKGSKRAISEPLPMGLDILPDDWHLRAEFIEQE